MKPIKVRSLKTGLILGTLVTFAVSDAGIRYVVIKPTSRALDLIIEVTSSFNSQYEVKP